MLVPKDSWCQTAGNSVHSELPSPHLVFSLILYSVFKNKIDEHSVGINIL